MAATNSSKVRSRRKEARNSSYEGEVRAKWRGGMSCRLYVAMSCGLYVALRARVNRRGSTQPAGEGLAARGVGAAGSTGGAEATGTRIGDTGKGQATAGKDDTTLEGAGDEEAT